MGNGTDGQMAAELVDVKVAWSVAEMVAELVAELGNV